MPTAFDVRALASTVRVELDDSLTAEERESIRSNWADLIVDGADAPNLTLRGSVAAKPAETKRDNVKSITVRSSDELADRLTSEITLGAIGGLSGDALMLHASAVALEDGGVVGLVGPSGRGKTTASRVLGRTFGYVTDETLAIRTDGSVVAYPKPLSIAPTVDPDAAVDVDPDAKNAVPASTLGLRTVPEGELHLSAIVLLDRRPGIEQPYVESVTLTEALSELAPQTSYLAALDRPLRTLAKLVDGTGGVRRVVYSEAETLPGLVGDILDARQERSPVLTDVAAVYRRDCDCFAQSLPGAPLFAEPEPGVVVRPGSYQRTNQNDALMIDDLLVVLVRHTVFVLDGIGPLIWLAADLSTEDEILDVVLRQLPPPPEGVDAAAAVSEALRHLVDVGLLLRRR